MAQNGKGANTKTNTNTNTKADRRSAVGVSAGSGSGNHSHGTWLDHGQRQPKNELGSEARTTRTGTTTITTTTGTTATATGAGARNTRTRTNTPAAAQTPTRTTTAAGESAKKGESGSGAKPGLIRMGMGMGMNLNMTRSARSSATKSSITNNAAAPVDSSDPSVPVPASATTTAAASFISRMSRQPPQKQQKQQEQQQLQQKYQQQQQEQQRHPQTKLQLRIPQTSARDSVPSPVSPLFSQSKRQQLNSATSSNQHPLYYPPSNSHPRTLSVNTPTPYLSPLPSKKLRSPSLSTTSLRSIQTKLMSPKSPQSPQQSPRSQTTHTRLSIQPVKFSAPAPVSRSKNTAQSVSEMQPIFIKHSNFRYLVVTPDALPAAKKPLLSRQQRLQRNLLETVTPIPPRLPIQSVAKSRPHSLAASESKVSVATIIPSNRESMLVSIDLPLTSKPPRQMPTTGMYFAPHIKESVTDARMIIPTPPKPKRRSSLILSVAFSVSEVTTTTTTTTTFSDVSSSLPDLDLSLRPSSPIYERSAMQQQTMSGSASRRQSSLSKRTDITGNSVSRKSTTETRQSVMTTLTTSTSEARKSGGIDEAFWDVVLHGPNKFSTAIDAGFVAAAAEPEFEYGSSGQSGGILASVVEEEDGGAESGSISGNDDDGDNEETSTLWESGNESSAKGDGIKAILNGETGVVKVRRIVDISAQHEREQQQTVYKYAILDREDLCHICRIAVQRLEYEGRNLGQQLMLGNLIVAATEIYPDIMAEVGGGGDGDDQGSVAAVMYALDSYF
ncbi:hypothetical protein HK100_000040 [Physocladia obscura]|uniref:Uncharacterized protein n=1 Tax=Physocladia obscura TaxID=109957 RepID=A0AAD5XHL4_9FUNG|nr:hypothetical protein HK100_000040 [Physocladia obscura]